MLDEFENRGFKRIKYFPLTLRQENVNQQQSSVRLDLPSRKTRAETLHYITLGHLRS